MMKNWKSTLAFFIFIGIYTFSVIKDKPNAVVEVAGYIALYSSVFMMFRSDFTTDLIAKLIDNIKIGK